MSSALPPRVAWTYGLVAEHLPDHKLTIRRLIASDQDFRELCDEFAEARAAMVARLLRRGEDEVMGSVDEWSEILERLTAEILIYIMAWQMRLLKG